MITKLDTAGFDFLAKHEGLVLHPYLDQVKIPTIGYGSTYYPDGRHVAMTDPPITIEQAQDIFNKTSIQYANAVHYATVPVLTQNQFNALFSFCYNIGVGGFKKSTVLSCVNHGITGHELKTAFLMWTKADGHVLSDLVKRRTDEYNLYVA